MNFLAVLLSNMKIMVARSLNFTIYFFCEGCIKIIFVSLSLRTVESHVLSANLYYDYSHISL